MEDDKQNYDLMGNFVKCLHDTYDKNKIKKYIIAHQTVQKVPYIPFLDDVVVVTMHNHPNNSPLSIADLAFFMSTRCVKLLTAVGNNGTVEAIQKKNAFDLSSAGPYFTSLLTSVGGIPEDKLRTLTREDILMPARVKRNKKKLAPPPARIPTVQD